MLHDNHLTKRCISLWIMKMERQHQHKKCERAGKCWRFPVFTVFYKLDDLTGPEGITVLQNPWILQPAGGNPLDIRACQEVWNIDFLGLPVLMLCFQEHPCGSAGFFSGVTFLSSSCGFHGMSSHRTCQKENSSQLDAFSYSFASFPNHISVVPYVKSCVGYSHR